MRRLDLTEDVLQGLTAVERAAVEEVWQRQEAERARQRELEVAAEPPPFQTSLVETAEEKRAREASQYAPTRLPWTPGS